MANNIDKKALGLRIRAIRQEKGMTLEEFGKLFGAGKGLVSRWENGLSIPSPSVTLTMWAIAPSYANISGAMQISSSSNSFKFVLILTVSPTFILNPPNLSNLFHIRHT